MRRYLNYLMIKDYDDFYSVVKKIFFSGNKLFLTVLSK